jgi:cytochrome c oxidase cbb3-type subunit III
MEPNNKPLNDNQEHYEIDTLTNDKIIKDHEYDGIRELDNDLPPWWKWLFYITIAIGIIYLVRLWVFRADDLIQAREFEKEMTQATLTHPRQPTDFQLSVLRDPVSLSRGRETFVKICQVCHLADGGGLVGPNLTDDYWIHGNSLEDMWKVVEEGVIEKGMIPYRDQLSPVQRLEVISYIIVDLYRTSPAKPKAPEGEFLEWPF